MTELALAVVFFSVFASIFMIGFIVWTHYRSEDSRYVRNSERLPDSPLYDPDDKRWP